MVDNIYLLIVYDEVFIKKVISEVECLMRDYFILIISEIMQITLYDENCLVILMI